MLLRFSVENFKSFKTRQVFSMIPSKVSQHKSHVIAPRNRKDLGALKAGVVYGANASGKSNIIRAMRHAQLMITQTKQADQRLAYEPFKLDKASLSQPSHFEFEIKCQDHNYAYGFIADHQSIHEEWLFEVDKKQEKALYERRGDQFDLTGMKQLVNDVTDFRFIEFTAKGTPSNRLLITECFERNVFKQFTTLGAIKNVFNWFKHTLNIVFPRSKYGGLAIKLNHNDDLATALTTHLNRFDTGITNIQLQPINFEHEVDLPAGLKQNMLEQLKPQDIMMINGPRNTRYHIERDINDQIVAKKLMTAHIDTDGDEVLFDLMLESDGTQRLMDVIPSFIELYNKEQVYVFDEIDRSLHADITYELMCSFLAHTSKKRSQLIVTTHETKLLDFHLLRRDEIWFTTKNSQGCTEVYALEEYKPRNDKDIRTGYLFGRFGALPKIKSLDIQG